MVCCTAAYTFGAGLVSDPARAADIDHPASVFAGRDFWYFLTPKWHELKGVKDEEFVKESGYWGIKFKMQRRNASPMRVLILNELSLIREGSAEKAEFCVTPDESTAKVIQPNALSDGKTATTCTVSGDPRPVLTRYNGVGATIIARFKAPAPLSKLTLAYGNSVNPDLEEVKFFADGIELKPASLKIADQMLTAEFMNAPAASEITLSIKSAPVKIELLDLTPDESKRCLEYPFSPFFLRVGLGEMFGLSEENFDRAAAEKILQKYDRTSIGFEIGEWDSNYFQMWHRQHRFYKDILSYCGPDPKNRFEAEAKLKRFWTWQKGLLCDRVWGMSGGIGYSQYGLEWGGKVAGMEITNHTSTIPHRTLLRFTAGAARQYGKPWLFYLAYYLGKYSPNSLASVTEKTLKGVWGESPDAGIAPSYARRLFFISYYMGATFFAFEAQPYGQVNRLPDGGHELNSNGRVLKEFYEWIRKDESKRGTWYAPVLLLTDYYHGIGRRDDDLVWGWSPIGFPLEKGDRMAEHFLRTIDPYDAQPEAWDKPPYSPNIHNSPLGDVFDTAFANPPSGNYPKIDEYPVVVLIDGYTPDPAQAVRLRDYVIGGGTLVINSIHRKAFDPNFMPAEILPETVENEGLDVPKLKLKGTQVILKTAAGNPLAVRNAYGNGSVIMTTPEYFLGKDLQQPTPYMGKLLEALQKEVLPFGIDGDIEFVISRLSSDSWKIILVNNKGLLKGPLDRVEKFDTKYTSHVTLTLPAGASAKEVYAGVTLERSGNKVTLEVPPSGVRVLEIGKTVFAEKKPSGLLGSWKLDGDVKDSSGNNRHGQAWDVKFAKVGSRSVLDLRQAKGRPLVDVNFNLEYPLVAGTFEAWAAPDLSAKWDSTAPISGSGYVISSPHGLLKLYVANGYWGFVYGEDRRGPACIDGRWAHLVATWSGFEARFYIDGKEVMSQTGPIKFSSPGFPYSQNSPTFTIGAYSRGQHLRQFQGLIGGVKLYNRPLSSEEISISYRAGVEIYK